MKRNATAQTAASRGTTAAGTRSALTGRAAGRLILGEFLPYRLSLLANTVSASLAEEYERRFRLPIPQWRVMAVLGLEPGLSAQEVCERTAMDKVTVSRAVAALVRAGRVVRRIDAADRRRAHLRLSARGESVYAQIVRAARALEADLLRALSPGDASTLDRMLWMLQDRAQRRALRDEAAGAPR